MIVDLDRRGDEYLEHYRVERLPMVIPDGNAAGSWYVPVIVTCLACLHEEELHFAPAFVESEDWWQRAADEGACPCWLAEGAP